MQYGLDKSPVFPLMQMVKSSLDNNGLYYIF